MLQARWHRRELAAERGLSGVLCGQVVGDRHLNRLGAHSLPYGHPLSLSARPRATLARLQSQRTALKLIVSPCSITESSMKVGILNGLPNGGTAPVRHPVASYTCSGLAIRIFLRVVPITVAAFCKGTAARSASKHQQPLRVTCGGGHNNVPSCQALEPRKLPAWTWTRPAKTLIEPVARIHVRACQHKHDHKHNMGEAQ